MGAVEDVGVGSLRQVAGGDLCNDASDPCASCPTQPKYKQQSRQHDGLERVLLKGEWRACGAGRGPFCAHAYLRCQMGPVELVGPVE